MARIPKILAVNAFVQRHILKVIVVLILILTIGVSNFPRKDKPALFLPGTQIGLVEGATSAQTCDNCHGPHSRDVEIFPNWEGSMMANSARDPIFYAALAVSNYYRSAAGDYCIRCHSPMGWLVGHSEDFTGQSLVGTDLDGVQCDFCHRSMDPLNPDSTAPTMSYPVPGYGNGMLVVEQNTTPKRGPYDSVNAPHTTLYDPFFSTSNLCGVCHDVSNPLNTVGMEAYNNPPYAYAPLERTFSEWAMSEYATYGDSGTCQSCHMKDTSGYACVYGDAPFRADVARHDLTGGNTFVPDILPDFWQNLDTAALQLGKMRAMATLQRAADLSVTAVRSGDSVIASVRVTNLTGHKLPTGYPEGRRMWINIIGLGASGDTVYTSGSYDTLAATLTADAHLKIYQATMGLRDSTAHYFGLSAGPSFYFSLNDTFMYDNRIPPRGFTNANFASRLASPIGVTYADSQYWDDTKYVLPLSVKTVQVVLYYQTISKDYEQFLLAGTANNTYDWNRWGARLDSSWQVHGRSRPVAMGTQTVAVVDTVTGVKVKHNLPFSFAISQNYPNPFNPTTNFQYQVPTVTHVVIKVYDVSGQEVTTLVNKTVAPGRYSEKWDGHGFSSGVYFYRINAGSYTATKKMLLMK
jgi:hypothetical protein